MCKNVTDVCLRYAHVRYSFMFDGVKYTRAANTQSQRFFLWSPKVLSKSNRLTRLKKNTRCTWRNDTAQDISFFFFAAMQHDPSPFHAMWTSHRSLMNHEMREVNSKVQKESLHRFNILYFSQTLERYT
uniref:Uncharacterized protein n=1 Tax=Rhipicephalus zambeziensis TaxID=60191 RepID=A0A224YL67_9ACAR